MKVIITAPAERDLARLDRVLLRRVFVKLQWLSEHFSQTIPQPLEGRWQGLYKLRIGDWRVIYELNRAREELVVHLVDHRSKIYKRKT